MLLSALPSVIGLTKDIETFWIGFLIGTKFSFVSQCSRYCDVTSTSPHTSDEPCRLRSLHVGKVLAKFNASSLVRDSQLDIHSVNPLRLSEMEG